MGRSLALSFPKTPDNRFLTAAFRGMESAAESMHVVTEWVAQIPTKPNEYCAKCSGVILSRICAFIFLRFFFVGRSLQ